MVDYTPTAWKDYKVGGTLITAARLNKLENGVRAVAVAATQAGADAATAIKIATSAEGDGLDLIASRLTFKEDKTTTVGIASDSTANDADDWVGVLLRLIAARDDALRVEHWRWDDKNQRYLDPDVIQAGKAIAASGGVMYHDTFTRTGEVIGSKPDSGAAWRGVTGWTADGQTAGAVRVGATILGDVDSRVCTATAKLIITTAQTGANQQMILSVASSASDYITAYLAISATGVVTGGIYTNSISSGGYLSLAGITAAELGLTSNSATAQAVTLTLDVTSAGVVTYSITTANKTVTKTATLSHARTRHLGYGASAGCSALMPGIRLDELQFETPMVPAHYRMLRVLNGAKAGGTQDYQTARMDALYPANMPLDAYIFSHGHNYGHIIPEDFLGLVDDFRSLMTSKHPNALPILASQNQEWDPREASYITDHTSRQSALRQYAHANGIAYIPGFEAISKRSEVAADGIHPTNPPAGTTTTGYGATTWATAALAALDDKMMH